MTAYEIYKLGKVLNLNRDEFKKLLIENHVIMQTLKKVEIVPVFVDEIPDTLKQDILYISNKYETISHLCLCGCGFLSVLPLTKNGWFLKRNNQHPFDRISLAPSILNGNCPNKSHYIITKNVANFV